MEKTSRQAVLESVRGLRLCEFDWDGVGGLPMRGDVADTIFDIYECVGETQQDSFDSLPYPVVSLNTNGTIELAYKDTESGRELLLTFQSLGVITYIKAFGDGQTSIEGTIRVDMLDFNGSAPCSYELIELLDWLAED